MCCTLKKLEMNEDNDQLLSQKAIGTQLRYIFAW